MAASFLRKIATVVCSRHIWVAALVAFFLPAARLSAQDLVSLTHQCDYFSEKKGDQIYAFPADASARELVRQILSAVDSTANFQLHASNVATVTAGISGDTRIVLYNQFLFGAENKGKMKWINLAILAHQIGHHVNKHSLVKDSDQRKAMELEADRFSAYVLFKLGASAEQAAYALQTDEALNQPSNYPSRSSRVDSIIAVWHSAKTIHDNYDFAEVTDEIPKFPWPPPKPSALATLSTLAINRGGATTLQNLADFLESAMDKAGYSERSFYSVPEGFALVSRIEQISETGEPKTGYDRWSLDVKPPHVFSMRSYITALFSAHPGRFRIIAFIVTPHPVSSDSAGATYQASKDWLWSGANRLPSSIGQIRYTPDYSCLAYVFEFERPTGGGAAVQMQPGTLDGKQHLEKAALWHSLTGL
jgi:hypothetical protein